MKHDSLLSLVDGVMIAYAVIFPMFVMIRALAGTGVDMGLFTATSLSLAWAIDALYIIVMALYNLQAFLSSLANRILHKEGYK